MKNQALFSSKDKSKKLKYISPAAIFVWLFKGLVRHRVSKGRSFLMTSQKY